MLGLEQRVEQCNKIVLGFQVLSSSASGRSNHQANYYIVSLSPSSLSYSLSRNFACHQCLAFNTTYIALLNPLPSYRFEELIHTDLYLLIPS